MRFRALAGGALLVSLLALAGHVSAQSKNLAPGFSALALGSRVAIMPTDIELFSEGELYALLYAAPQLGFFARHQRSVEQMARSASLKM